MKIIKFGGTAILLAGVVSLAPVSAFADAAEAIATAARHAGIASGQGDIGAVRLHLHHVVNCLVGPDGEGFDESAGNPCQAAGGAIPQTMNAEAKEKLMKVAAEAQSAIDGGDLDAAKTAAASVQEMLAE